MLVGSQIRLKFGVQVICVFGWAAACPPFLVLLVGASGIARGALTDLHGRARELKLHNPVRVTERVHQMSLEFRYLEQAGSAYSDFDDECLPALAFAARATSSYAGLFPPMTLREALGNVAERGLTWPEVGSFAEQQLQLPPDDFLDWPFMDGGVLNNKPFDTSLNLKVPISFPSFFRPLKYLYSDI